MTTRMTRAMRASLQLRLADLGERIDTLDESQAGDDSVEATALLMQLTRERDDIADALRNAAMIDDEPFDYHAIDVGDVVTIEDVDGQKDSYVLVDGGVGTRARTDWVSVDSPLGSALLGRATGERVEVVSPQGTASYVVVDFRRASERGAPATCNSLPSEAFIG